MLNTLQRSVHEDETHMNRALLVSAKQGPVHVCVCVLTDLCSKARVWWTHLGDFKAEVFAQE